MLKNLIISAKSLRDTKVLCICSIMVAMYVVLDMLQIPLAPQIVISFSFIPIAVTGWMFGIIPAMIVGGISDILSFLIKPTGAFFPGFTVTSILTGAVFGLVLYKAGGKSIWLKSILSKLLVTILLNIGLNTLWTSILTGKAYIAILYGRIVKNAVMLPVEIILMALLIFLLSKHKVLNK
ncbi:MAG: folate family ECF transporter S component [Ruminococcaceae bacterium]|nr:folate family ECF transporter S component [Oscillospiraceae bacterium]